MDARVPPRRVPGLASPEASVRPDAGALPSTVGTVRFIAAGRLRSGLPGRRCVQRFAGRLTSASTAVATIVNASVIANARSLRTAPTLTLFIPFFTAPSLCTGCGRTP